MSKYDTLFVNGRIYTEDDDRSRVQALAVKDRRIAFAGSDAEAEALKAEAESVVDLGGKMMLPGFIDAHMHLSIAGPEMLFKVVLHDLDNEADYLKRIKEYVDSHPEMERYEGAGWINPAFGPEGPTRQALDSVCPDKPIIVDSGDHHTMWANTAAIELCGITAETTVPEGNVIEKEPDGYPSGAFREFAAIKLLDKARLDLGKEEYKAVIRYMQDFYAEMGVTTVMDALNPVYNEFNEALFEMERDGELKFKVRAAFQAVEDEPFKYFDEYLTYREKGRAVSDKIKFEMVKILTDGVVEGKTGYLKEPYEDDPDYCGDPIWDMEDLVSFCKRADAEDFDIHFHVIGDAACCMALDCIDEVVAANGAKPDRRVSATHLQVVDPADIPRLAAHRFICITNPYWFFKEKGYFEGLEKPYLGERAYREYPMKDLFDAGLIVGAASDYSVTPDPFAPKGMQIAMTRLVETADPELVARSLEADAGIDAVGPKVADPILDPVNGPVLGPDQRVSLQQMIDAFTRNNSYFLRDEAITGTLEVGKCADLVVLEKDLFEVPAAELHNVRVVMTMADGEVTFEA